MDNGLRFQTAAGLEDSTFMKTGGGIWNSLEDLKQEVSQELLAEGPLCHNDASGFVEDEISEANALEIEMAHRRQLESQLNAITHAQDRLLDGSYGKCEDCGQPINPGRLVVNPSASLCLDCQRFVDGDKRFSSL